MFIFKKHYLEELKNEQSKLSVLLVRLSLYVNVIKYILIIIMFIIIFLIIQKNTYCFNLNRFENSNIYDTIRTRQLHLYHMCTKKERFC